MSPFYKIENSNVRAIRYRHGENELQMRNFVAWRDERHTTRPVTCSVNPSDCVVILQYAGGELRVTGGDWLISPAPGIFFSADLGEHADVFLGTPLSWEAWDSAQHAKPAHVMPNFPDPIRQDVLDAIASEKEHQIIRHGDHRHSPAEWLLILEKLMCDARHAWVLGNGDLQAMHEIRQIATTAIAAMEQCGAPLRAPLGQPGKFPGEA